MGACIYFIPYNNENNLTIITDGNSHVTGFQSDQFGRVKETDFPSGHAESYTYDAIGKERQPQSGPRFPANSLLWLAHSREIE